MATQRIASASIRGAANAKKSLTTLGASGSQQESRRWKSTPAIGLDNSSGILKGKKLESSFLIATFHVQLSIKYLSFIAEDIGLVVKDLPKGERKVDELDLTFLDHKAAFKSKTTWQVLRAYLVFNLCSIKPLVDNNEAVR